MNMLNPQPRDNHTFVNNDKEVYFAMPYIGYFDALLKMIPW